MSKNASLITSPGYVLISSQGIGHCGFNYDYKSDLFDGCRMGQLSPVMWAQSQLTEALHGEVITKGAINACDHGGDFDDIPDLAHAFASMVMNMSPYPLGSPENARFIGYLRAVMTDLDREWSKTSTVRI